MTVPIRLWLGCVPANSARPTKEPTHARPADPDHRRADDRPHRRCLAERPARPKRRLDQLHQHPRPRGRLPQQRGLRPRRGRPARRRRRAHRAAADRLPRHARAPRERRARLRLSPQLQHGPADDQVAVGDGLRAARHLHGVPAGWCQLAADLRHVGRRGQRRDRRVRLLRGDQRQRARAVGCRHAAGGRHGRPQPAHRARSRALGQPEAGRLRRGGHALGERARRPGRYPAHLRHRPPDRGSRRHGLRPAGGPGAAGASAASLERADGPAGHGHLQGRRTRATSPSARASCATTRTGSSSAATSSS